MKKYRFGIALALLAICCQLLILFVYEKVTGKYPSVLIQSFPAYFLIINLLMHFFVIRAAKESPAKFVRTFIGMTTAKMMISLIFVLIVGLVSRPEIKAPVLAFVLLYLLFMVLEVIFVVKDLNELKNKQ